MYYTFPVSYTPPLLYPMQPLVNSGVIMMLLDVMNDLCSISSNKGVCP